MKSKFFTLFAAFVLLFSAQASAQVNGDVNDDGKVNEQDIAAILEIMAEAGGVKEQTKYYWYVSATDPSTMTSISPIVTDTTSPGWRLIGTSVPTYSSTNMLYNPNVARIVTGTSLVHNYIAIPSKSSAIMRDGAGNPGTSVNLCTLIGTKTIENVEYNIYKTNSKAKSLGYPIY